MRAENHRSPCCRTLTASRTLYTTSQAWKVRTAALREGFLRGAQLWPLPEKTPLNPIIHSRREHDGYTVENVALETLPRLGIGTTPALLVEPDRE